MKYDLKDGRLTVTAETVAEGVEICKHFNLKIEDHAHGLESVSHTSGTDDRPWFHQFALLPFEWLAPYYVELARVTGYTGPAFTIGVDALRYPGSGHVHNLRYTHLVIDAAIDADGYHAEGYIQASDWNGKSAARRAEINFREYLAAALGHTKSEPQYLRLGNGLLRENPNYLTHHRPTPKATSKKLFNLLFQHWFTNHATPAQAALWLEGEACYRTVVKSDTLAEAMLLHRYDSFHVDNYKRTVHLDEFRALGKEA